MDFRIVYKPCLGCYFAYHHAGAVYCKRAKEWLKPFVIPGNCINRKVK